MILGLLNPNIFYFIAEKIYQERNTRTITLYEAMNENPKLPHVTAIAQRGHFFLSCVQLC